MPRIWELTHNTYQQAEGIAQELQDANVGDDRRTELEDQYQALVVGWAKQLESLGCEIKGLWLVDFDNGKGYYCWKYPERSLDNYHSYEEGFAGRMKIN